MVFKIISLMAIIGLSLTKECTDVNEVHNSCGSACPMTCTNMNETGRACIAMCVDGCFCKPGLVRSAQGKCVLTRDCPTVTYVGECNDPNEFYTTCGTSCRHRCKTHPPKLCSEVCKEGCFCYTPYVRDKSSGECVLPENFPSAT